MYTGDYGGLFELVVGFDWDENNSVKNYDKHGVTQLECEEVFFDAPIYTTDINHTIFEKRFWLIGLTSEGRYVHITFTIRGNLVRIISARSVSKKERKIYEKAQKNTKL